MMYAMLVGSIDIKNSLQFLWKATFLSKDNRSGPQMVNKLRNR